MLGKILKYDLKWLNKMLLPLYLVLVGLSVFTKILILLGDQFTIFNIVSKFSIALLIFGCIGTLFYTVFVIIKRYTKNLFKDEAYLTHTLPISRTNLLNSKIISSIIYSIISILIILLSLLIAFYTKENIEVIKQFMQLSLIDEMSVYHVTIIMAAVLFLDYILYMMLIFAGITLGYSRNDQKNLYSVIACVGLYFITQMINIIILAVTAIINYDWIKMMETNTVNDSFIVILFVMLGIEMLLCITGFYFIARHTLKTKINVD